MVSLNDMADRPPRPLADGEVLELGARRVRHIDTPHVPHAWEARVVYEETTGTLFSGDLFSALGDGPAVTEGDILEPAIQAEIVFQSSSLAPSMPATIDRLADLEPRTIALMHGSSFVGDGGAALRALAKFYAERISAAA